MGKIKVKTINKWFRISSIITLIAATITDVLNCNITYKYNLIILVAYVIIVYIYFFFKMRKKQKQRSRRTKSTLIKINIVYCTYLIYSTYITIK